MNNKKGVLLINLGTPDAPTPKAVKTYLKAFLSDQRVIDYPKWLWQIILRGIILNVRPRKVAHAYQTIWTEQGSPLRSISYEQANALQLALSEHAIPVEVGMTYGNPSISSAIDKLIEKGVDDIIAIPLYPQYSATTTAAAFDVIAKDFMRRRILPNLRFINSYSHHPEYIKVLAQSIEQYWQQTGKQHLLMFSFHGIPKRYVSLGDTYQANCQQTARDVADYLGLNNNQWMLCYQSRVGKEEWLQPYTDKTLEHLPTTGQKCVDLVCPAFSVDCLETLEEIAEENKSVFLDAGGEEYRYIPALNAQPAHIEFLSQLVKANL
ncbi:ferrochelatase [Saccharobesus litoralis]|uniref:Ferrochelatase n=1 Tax=Saccharobesus litoralis TaxID=2172099 RepID=A0A2S0VVJ5_9ALTE|nr:ferrochelatase [Saccharobesus litoralis]AWB68130.1 ferrochelatase [Saccharobesus litoralis]